jgi:PAS domain S-box-containing protein
MSQPGPPLRWLKRSAISRYAIGVLSIVAALAASKMAVADLHTEPFVSLFLCAIMFVAWFCGFGPGLLSTVLGLLAFDYYLVPPVNSFAVAADEITRLVLFSTAALFVNLLSAAQRNATRSLERSRDDLLAAIEDQRRTEEELRRSEQRFRDFAETASDWFWETGPDFRLINVSRESAMAAGRIGKTIWEFATDVEEEPEKWRLHRGTLDAHAAFRGFRFRAMLADGSPIYFAASGKSVFDAAGNFLGYRGVASDVTATVRAEQAEAALQEARADLAHATRVTTLGELTASIAHEVNQPLAAIVANAEACLRWLDRGTPNMDAARRSVEWVINDGNRAAEVIGRVRALAAKTSTDKSELDINEVINEVRTLMRRELSDHRVSLRMELGPVAMMVRADRVQLQQVIINLVMNGIEAMQPVTDRLRELVIRSQLNEANQVVVMVQDRGLGISADDADRLFSAFFTTKSNGLGLGLSICRSIIEGHGGRLSAFRNSGPGATFQFTLPLHQEAAF